VISYRSRPSISPAASCTYLFRSPPHHDHGNSITTDERQLRNETTKATNKKHIKTEIEESKIRKSKEIIRLPRFSAREALSRLASEPWEAALPDLNHTISEE
jgi:hypothetical protein